ncbi:MAG: TonB-dependent receptor [Paucibacter sp.]|nr:TonB-dependent receptor [Roseateles sp.]
MKVKQTPIAAAVSIALLSTAMAVHAQDQAPQATAAPAAAADTPQQLDTVVVTGVRASQQKALAVKRNSEDHIDVISAEDIGKMPDKNVADSLSRIAGVTILNSPTGGSGGFDERDRVALHGTNPSLTQTLVDGHPIANGDWFVLDQTGAGVGRSVSYSLLPSEMVGEVDVRKDSEASLAEGGTAGSVNIITRKPLDFTQSMTFQANVGAVYADLPAKTDPQLSALFNFHNDAKTFGVLLQAFSEKRDLRRDGIETLGFINTMATADATSLKAPGLAGVYLPDLIGAAYFTQKRERTGGVARVEFKPNSDFDINLSGFSSKMNADNYNRNFMIINRPGFTAYSSATLGSYTTAVDNQGENTLTSMNLSWATPSAAGVYDMISRKASASSNFLALDSSLKVNDALKFKFNGGVSKGLGKTNAQDVYEANIYATSASFQLNGPGSAPSFSLGGINPSAGITHDPVTPAAGLGFGWIFGVENLAVYDKDTWAQVDGEYTLDSGLVRSISFGVRSSGHDRHTGPTVNQRPGCDTGAAYEAQMFTWAGTYYCSATDTNAASSPSPYALVNAPAFTQFYPSNFGAGLGGSVPANIAYPTPAALAAFDANYTNRDPNSAALVHSPIQGGEYGVKETITAAYAEANLEGSGWTGKLGLRAVHTQQSSHAWTYTQTSATPDVISAWGSEYLTTSDRSYNNMLPSASMKIDITKDVVAHLGLSRTLTRADYTALSAVANLTPPKSQADPTVGSGSAGNPNLKPIISTNFDSDIAWYFAPRAYVSMGAFHMQMGSYITDGTFSETLPTLLPLTSASGSPQSIVNRQYLLTGPVNKKASVTGLEFAIETPVYKNFGVNANYTYSDGHDETGHVLQGSVQDSFNLGGYFENDSFSARVNYGYTSDNYIGTDRGTPYYQKGVGVLSASLGYKYNDHFSLSLDGQNLNDPILRYYASDVQPRAVYNNGRQYYLTAHIKY